MNLKKKVLALALALTFITPMTVIPAAAADGKAILDEADFYLTFEDGIKDDKIHSLGSDASHAEESWHQR